MDVIKARNEARMIKISQIVATLKKAFSAGLDVDKENMIREVCSVTGISRRTALEYLNIALVSFDTTEIKPEGRVLIKEKKEEIEDEA